MNVNEFNTHSFRLCDATSAFVNGKPEDELKKVGHWSS